MLTSMEKYFTLRGARSVLHRRTYEPKPIGISHMWDIRGSEMIREGEALLQTEGQAKENPAVTLWGLQALECVAAREVLSHPENLIDCPREWPAVCASANLPQDWLQRDDYFALRAQTLFPSVIMAEMIENLRQPFDVSGTKPSPQL